MSKAQVEVIASTRHERRGEGVALHVSVRSVTAHSNGLRTLPEGDTGGKREVGCGDGLDGTGSGKYA